MKSKPTYEIGTIMKPTKEGWKQFIVCTRNEWITLAVIGTLGM